VIANSALLAALVLLLAILWVGGETTFLVPYKRELFRAHGATIGVFLVVVFLNLFALCHGLARVLFLKDTGHKLHHVDRQLATRDSVLSDLTDHLRD
jgi:hypothetical protein